MRLSGSWTSCFGSGSGADPPLTDATEGLREDVAEPRRSNAVDPREFVHGREGAHSPQFQNLLRAGRTDVNDSLQLGQVGGIDVDAGNR